MSRLKRLKASLTQFPDIAAPPWWLAACESRVFWEYMGGATTLRLLKRLVPKGDGHPVLVLPGLGASDLSTAMLRQFLDDLGYVTYPWGIGRNKGMTDAASSAVDARLQAIYSRHQCKVTVIGQSLGGVFAREVAKSTPHLVRQVITLGSPFTGHPLASTGVRLYEWLSGDRIDVLDFNRHLQIRVKPPVPTTSIYSKMDGVVAWRCSIESEDSEGENIHLRGGTHCGMGFNPTALYLLAKRLAQPGEHWTPFEPRGLEKLVYGINDHRKTVTG